MIKRFTAFITAVLMLFTLFCSTAYAASGDTIVCVTRSGQKYHTQGCRYLKKSCIEINLQDAVNGGYEPCKVCRPPVLDAVSNTAAETLAPSASSLQLQDGMKDDGKIHVYPTGKGEKISTPNDKLIKSITYYPESGHLIVDIDDQEYVYANVSEKTWTDFKTAKSAHSFYNSKIKAAEEYRVTDCDGKNEELIIIDYADCAA